MEKVVIIGAGAAGYTAAVYASRAKLEPLLITGWVPGGQLTTTTDVENYPGFKDGVDGTELMQIMSAQAERFGTRYLEYKKVETADLSGQPLKVTLDDGETIESQTLIIATGADAKYLGLENEIRLRDLGGGVSACAVCDGAMFPDVPLCVVGGGDTAMEEATYLTKYASKVYIIHRRDEFRASKIMADRALNSDKIEVCWNSTVEDVLGETQVEGVRIKDVNTGETRDIEVGGYFSAIGHKPNTDPFKGQLDMDETGYLITDSTKTNIPGVYAAGDCQDSVYRQAITAAGTGCMAALEAEGFLEGLKD